MNLEGYPSARALSAPVNDSDDNCHLDAFQHPSVDLQVFFLIQQELVFHQLDW